MNSVVDYMQVALPKWPQMIVTGAPVTVEQAKEIILRTDDFLTSTSEYAGGNNREFNNNYRSTAGLTNNDWGLESYVREEFKYINTSYVSNSWASSSFVYGPHGWCSPTGQIHFSDNVGKWPNVSDIYDDWVSIAEAFPFLDLTATLFSGESCEDDTYAMCTIYVKNGKVWVAEPTVVPPTDSEKQARNIFDNRTEIGLPSDWYDEYAARIRVVAARYYEINATA